MSRKAQEQEERFYLDKFLDALSLQPEEIARGADPPDFILFTAGRRIAVEVTGFHSAAKGSAGHPRRAVEEEWNVLRETVSEKRRSHPQLDATNCHLSFMGLLVPPRSEHAHFADELIALAQETSAPVTDTAVERTDLAAYPLLDKYLDSVTVSRPDCYCTWDWDKNVAFVGLNEGELKRTILPKLAVPRPPDVDEHWLLVVSGHQLSQSMGLPHVEELCDYACLNSALADGPFDKAYLFQYMFGRILRWDRGNGWGEVRPAQWAT